jgi:hypothetical protein
MHSGYAVVVKLLDIEGQHRAFVRLVNRKQAAPAFAEAAGRSNSE